MLRWLVPVAVLCAAVLPQVHAEAPVDTLVFIGERLSVEPCTQPRRLEPVDAERRRVRMDEPFNVCYRIVQPIVGTPAGDTLGFCMADPCQDASFAHFENAPPFVAMADLPDLHECQAVPVHRTAAGR